MTERLYGGSIPMRRRYFLPASAPTRSSARSNFPSSTTPTLAKRKAACEAEMEVNRPYAPGIYLRVVAITREADGALAHRWSGEPVEWAVEMQRFDENATLDHLADRRKIDARHWPTRSRASSRPRTRTRRSSRPSPGSTALRAIHRRRMTAAFRANAGDLSHRGCGSADDRQAARASNACAACCVRAAGKGWSGAATATCISATSR